MSVKKSKSDRHDRIVKRWHQEIDRVKAPDVRLAWFNNAAAQESVKPYEELNNRYLKILALLENR